MKRTVLKRGLLCISIFSVVLSGAFAASVRDMGMGLYDYPWFIDGLHTYVYDNPAYIKGFKDSIYVERVGVVNGENKGGIVYNPAGTVHIGVDLGAFVDNALWNTSSVGSLFHIDTYSSKAISKYTHSDIAQAMLPYQVELLDGSILDITDPYDASYPVGTSVTSPELREKLKQRNFSAFFGYNFSTISIGSYIGYATSWKHNRKGDVSTDTKEEYNLINSEYAVGFGANIRFNNKVTMDIAASYNLYVLDNNYTADKPGVDFDMDYKTKGAMDIGGNARINYRMTDNHMMHFYIAYKMLNRSTEGAMVVDDRNIPANDVSAQDGYNRQGHVITFGISDEMTMGNNVIGFVGFSTQFKTFKNNYSGKDLVNPANNVDTYTLEYATIDVPIIVGLEAGLSENWMGRFGVVQKIYKPITQEGKNIVNQGGSIVPTTIDDAAASSTTLSMGLSYKLKNFTFDWLANVELFTVGPYMVSGKAWTVNENNPLAFAFAIRYNFTLPANILAKDK